MKTINKKIGLGLAAMSIGLSVFGVSQNDKPLQIQMDLKSPLRTISDPSTQELYGPFFIKSQIESGKVPGLEGERAKIAAANWQIVIDAAKTSGRQMPILETIEAKKTALLVVDMTRCFLDKGAAIEVPAGRDIVPNINKLAQTMREKGGTVIFFRYLVDEHVGKLKNFEGKSYLGLDRLSPMVALRKDNPQFQLYPDLDVKKGDIIMDKTRYSAVLGSNIVEVLKAKGIKNVIIAGVTTDVCAGNTGEDLMQEDFNVIFVWDGTAALDRLGGHELPLAKDFVLYGDVMPTNEIISRIK